MGVPAFFRWLSQKYPKIISPVIETLPEEIDGQIVPVDTTGPNPNNEEFDNLYLDMNGIVHPCSHPEDRPAPETEEEMMLEVFKYTDRVVSMVRPRKLLMMAVDGVAPRAKMNQQRSRRFRSAQEAKEKEEQIAEFVKLLASKGTEVDPGLQKKGWDSNAITPGTPFMDILSIALRYWVIHKLNSDPAWSKLKIIISDSSVPGEGEHKIMEFVRSQRADSEHNPNTRHVIYGLDADLIMLGLATHEPHFRVLREDVFAGGDRGRPCTICNQKGHKAEECTGKAKEKDGQFDEKSKASSRKPFIWLNVGVLREYLSVELKVAGLPFKFDLERALDDWVFLCFFVGNDFLPHFPSLEIRDQGIDTLTTIWRESLSSMGGFVTTDGIVNLERAQQILNGLAKQEDAIFRKRRQVEERREESAKRRKLQQEGSGLGSNPSADGSQLPPHRGKSERVPVYHPTNIPLFAPNDTSEQTKRLNHDTVVNRANIRTANYANKSAAATLKAQLLGNSLAQQSPGDPDAQSETSATLSASVLGKRKAETFEADSSTQTPNAEPVPVEESGDTVKLWEPGYRDRYYEQKFNKPSSDSRFRNEVANAYVEGLCWVLLYYFQGCPSWTWYYPYHYAPFAQDFEEIGSLDIKFNLGTPFRPFEQLMGVLPAASKHNIPKVFWPLMTEADSPIIDFYPEDFPIDLNGKKFAWQGVALLPFIDEGRLLGEMHKLYPKLSDDEKARNDIGSDTLLFSDSHPLYDQLAALFYSKRAASKEVDLDPRISEGLAGVVIKDDNFIPHSTVAFPFGETGTSDFGDIEDDRSMSLKYVFPEKKSLHKSMLLRGVELNPILTAADEDFILRKQQGGGRTYGGGHLDRHGYSRGPQGRQSYDSPLAPPSGVRGPSLPAGYIFPEQSGSRPNASSYPPYQQTWGGSDTRNAGFDNSRNFEYQPRQEYGNRGGYGGPQNYSNTGYNRDNNYPRRGGHNDNSGNNRGSYGQRTDGYDRPQGSWGSHNERGSGGHSYPQNNRGGGGSRGQYESGRGGGYNRGRGGSWMR